MLFCISYCGNFVTKRVSDSLAQTTLKSQRLPGANSYKKMFHMKHHGGITVYSIAYYRMFVNSYRTSEFNVVVTMQNNNKKTHLHYSFKRT